MKALRNPSATRWQILIAATLIAVAAPLRAEDGSQAWLRYAPPVRDGILSYYQKMPAAVVNLDTSPTSVSAKNELVRGVRSMLGRTLRISPTPQGQDAWVLGTQQEIAAALPAYLTA